MRSTGLVGVVMAALAGVMPAARAECPPFGAMPNYVADPATFQIRDFDAEDFPVGDDETRFGRVCRQSYHPRGADGAAAADIDAFYRAAAKHAGADILYDDEAIMVGRLGQHGKEIWLKTSVEGDNVAIVTLEVRPLTLRLTKPSGVDYRLLGHMPNYEATLIANYPIAEFDKLTQTGVRLTVEQKSAQAATFLIRETETGAQDVLVEGSKYVVSYKSGPDASPASTVEIHENYRAALRGLGAEIVYVHAGDTVALREDGNRLVWIKIEGGERDYTLTAVEERDFRAFHPVPSAPVLKTALDRDGHVPLYFDFGLRRSSLRADAEPLITLIADLFRDDPGLRLTIAGFTDDVGDPADNVRLSTERAKAVVDALMKRGIDAWRVKAVGYGPENPIGDNDRSRGRADNRRIELVKP